MSSNERMSALKILTALLDNKTSLAQSMPSQADLKPLTKELCFGFCRHYYRLSAIAESLLDKKPKSTEVWVALLLGLYQLNYLQLPDYAVVKETVALLEKSKKVWAKGLINAVLRNFCRKQQEILAALEHNPSFIHGHPKHLVERLQDNWPNDWQAITQANDARPPMTLRVNILKNTPAEYLQTLKDSGIKAQLHPVASHAIVLEEPCDVYALPGFDQGCVSVQDAAAQLAVCLLQLHPGLRVLDACSAPGGKTCHILEAEPKLKTCVAMDIDSRRLARVQENLTRLHLQANLMQDDAMHPEQWWDGQLFDRILLDAPCSATGVIRRHADIKLLRTEEEIAAISKTQKGLLHALWPLLVPGGVLVYATCSVLLIENEQQITNFVAEKKDCIPVKNALSWGRSTGHGQQILPGEQQMDGFFYSVLRKEVAV